MGTRFVFPCCNNVPPLGIPRVSQRSSARHLPRGEIAIDDLFSASRILLNPS